jgi:hypothetical protein
VPGQSPYGNGGNPWPIEDGARIQAENYDTGGEGVAYHDADSSNNGGQYRSDGVDIEGTSDTGGGYNVGWIAVDEWLEYTTDVTGGTYDVEARVASNVSDPGDLRIKLDGVTLCTFPVAGTGGWQNWTTLTCAGETLSGGSDRILRLEMVNGGSFNVNWIEFAASAAPTDTPVPPTATPTPVPTNKLVNPGLESGDVDWGCIGDNWSIGQPGSGNTHSGTWAFTMSCTQHSGGGPCQSVSDVPTNTDYVASFWLKGSGTIKIVVNDSGWSYIGGEACAATGTWTRCSWEFNTGSNTGLIVQLQDHWNGTAYVDDVYLGVP